MYYKIAPRIPLGGVSDNFNSKKHQRPSKPIKVWNMSKNGFTIAEIIRLNTVQFTVNKYTDNSFRITLPQLIEFKTLS